MSLPETEFAALRQTIAARGTARVILVPVTLIGWSALTAQLVLFSDLPVAALIPLTLLAGGFEAVHALHVAAERIGRYLQVFYEAEPGLPRWETTAMAVGPSLPGGGVDPLFAFLFGGATILNLIPALLPQPTLIELMVIAGLHLGFLFRIVRARGAAARQRAVELESFRALKPKQDR